MNEYEKKTWGQLFLELWNEEEQAYWSNYEEIWGIDYGQDDLIDDEETLDDEGEAYTGEAYEEGFADAEPNIPFDWVNVNMEAKWLHTLSHNIYVFIAVAQMIACGVLGVIVWLSIGP